MGRSSGIASLAQITDLWAPQPGQASPAQPSLACGPDCVLARSPYSFPPRLRRIGCERPWATIWGQWALLSERLEPDHRPKELGQGAVPDLWGHC